MARADAGDRIDYVVTYLEMNARPVAPIPHMPVGGSLALIRAEAPPADYFLYLYGQVGAAYEWTDWLRRPRAELDTFVSDPRTELFTLMLDGWPGGFFVLDTREDGVCDLAYFGLVPQAVGRGLGHWLLATAVHMGWDRPGVQRMTVNTNTLDHSRALGLYQRVGFVPVRREEASRILGRTREV
ncbi:GNAT family N-acetyltransferase [Limibaculum sp. FT325]|uniref:GNAT family N-acetyltransferase n=1 Tax=Thermohalobaculum sediminis TaxID=2939436 RepID=UPI0020BE26F2|nr:GNAT family N-acetyltransferase [Limibaculum sediminis]MCL5777432.1 GNAT family N-acetyltransferase [Limibaculum sediminis]